MATMLTPSQDEARRHALMRVASAAHSSREQRERLYAAIQLAADIAIPHREIAEAAGLTRQGVHKIITRQRNGAGMNERDKRTARRMQRQLEHGRRAGETRDNSAAEDMRQLGNDADKHDDSDDTTDSGDGS